MKKLGLATCAALALTATSASANGYWQDGTYYSYPSTTTQTYTSPATTQTYTAPSHTGVVGPVVSSGAVTYVQPHSQYGTTYVPSTTRTYVAPTTTYSAPTTYGTPSTVYTPRYGVPAYRPDARYDGRGIVRQRLSNQHNRIENALARGDLRRGEEARLRENLREIRRTFRAYRDNDGYIGRHEEAALIALLNKNDRRIFELANNRRVAGGRRGRAGPYAY